MKTVCKPTIPLRCAYASALSMLLLSACGRDDASAPVSTAPVSPAAAPASTAPQAPAEAVAPAPAAQPTTTTESAAPARTFDFVFSSQSADEAKDPRILAWEDSPCGMGPRARIERMPIDDPVLLPDWVVEFDESGKERRRWGTPYEAEVLGLDGDLLRFRVHGHAQAYWTDPQGRIGTLAGGADALPELQAPTIDCPALPTFPESAYLYCSLVTDTTQRQRRLAWEGPCT
jgi:hypothetical protein